VFEMGEYVKPVVETLNEKAEGVFAASGATDEGVVTCRFGRTEASAGVDDCQACSATGGESTSGQYFQKDYKGCPDNMPEK